MLHPLGVLTPNLIRVVGAPPMGAVCYTSGVPQMGGGSVALEYCLRRVLRRIFSTGLLTLLGRTRNFLRFALLW